MQLDNITNKCDWWRRLHPQSFCTAGTNVSIWQTSLSHSYDHLHFPPNTAGRGLFITHMKTKIPLNSEDAFIVATRGVPMYVYARIKEEAFPFLFTAVKQAAVRQHCN